MRKHVRQLRTGDFAWDPRQLFQGLWRFNESDIRAGLQEALRTFDRLVDAEGRSSVGATDDHELGDDPRLDGSTQAQQHLVSGDDRLAFEVPAALRSHLILDE